MRASSCWNSQAQTVWSVLLMRTSTPPERMQFLASGQLTDFAEALDGRPRQERKPVYVRNGAIYLARVEVLKRGVFIGDKPYGLKMPEERSVNIDTELDLVVADAVARHFFGDLCR